VLLEQQTQFQDGYTCEDLIRSAYSEFAEQAEIIAQQRGNNHAKAAGDWAVQGLPVDYVQWLYIHSGHQEVLACMLAKSKLAVAKTV
jgi:hypothetical protein